MTTTSTPQPSTLESGGARIADDVRPGPGAGGPPPLVLAGSPMDAGFTTLASRFNDRTVVTYDPRGTGRSTTPDPSGESTPEQHAEDLRRVVEAVGDRPVDVFASSGAAVNALALVARHRDAGLVRTVVAHEPPLVEVLPDRHHAWEAVLAIRDAYQRGGVGPGMARFISLTQHRGVVTDEVCSAPTPDPGAFGLPTGDDGRRDDALLGQNLLTCCGWRPDLEALAGASAKVVVAVGEGSEGELAHRAGEALALSLGTEPVRFPGDHAGFHGGEYGMTGEPEAFAARLREVLAG